MTTIIIPAGLDFTDLRLARDSSGDVSFDTAVINQIEAASGLPEGFFMGQPEDALGALIVQWCSSHRAAGGDPDPVAEELIGEVRAEGAAGSLSHKPGRA